MSGCFGQGVACPVLSSPGTAPGMRRASKYLPSRWQAGGARSSAWGGGWMSQSGEPEGELWPWLFQQRGHLNLPDCIVFTCDTRGPVVGKNQEDNSPGRTDSQFCPLPQLPKKSKLQDRHYVIYQTKTLCLRLLKYNFEYKVTFLHGWEHRQTGITVCDQKPQFLQCLMKEKEVNLLCILIFSAHQL